MSAAITSALNCPMCGAVYQSGAKACAACGEDLRAPVIANDRPPTWGDILMTLAVIRGVHAVMVVIVFALMRTIR